jgi:RNA polymerase sigma-70 factor (ECF subfamily)
MSEAGSGESEERELVALMIAYQAGRFEAFERLYGRLVSDVRRYLLASVRDTTLVEDLIQETFLEIHRSRRVYRPPLPVRPWARGIARNVLLRHRRAAWRRSREAQVAWVEDSHALGGAPDPRAIGSQDVEEALSRLPAARREAWTLHHVQGLSFRQVADRLKIGVGAAKLKSSRAMKALRLALGIAAEPGDD